jgi:hypothetical protein
MRFRQGFCPPCPHDCSDNALSSNSPTRKTRPPSLSHFDSPVVSYASAAIERFCEQWWLRLVRAYGAPVARLAALAQKKRVPLSGDHPGGFSIIEAFKKPLKSPSAVRLFAALSLLETLVPKGSNHKRRRGRTGTIAWERTGTLIGRLPSAVAPGLPRAQKQLFARLMLWWNGALRQSSQRPIPNCVDVRNVD